MKIIQVIPLPGYILDVEFDNGKRGAFNVLPYLSLEAFCPLEDFSEFKQVQNGKYYVAWPCGADLSADTIEAHLI